MGGKMPASWWRAYRARNRERINAQLRARRAVGRVRGDRSAEYAKRNRAIEPLAPLFPDLVRGSRLSFWDDELRMDLRQERALALIEQRDPDEAVRTYRTRELAWLAMTAPLLESAA